jgi:hypothetical protein
MTDAQRAAADVAEPNLVWSGAQLVGHYGSAAALFAPTTIQGASSVNHFSYNLLSTELLNPYYTAANHNLGRALYTLKDEGWSAHACTTFTPASAPATPEWSLVLMGLGFAVAGLGAMKRRGAARA